MGSRNLVTVGHAARFLVANFEVPHGRDVDIRIVADALERAAETHGGYEIVRATNAMIALLESEMLNSYAIHALDSSAQPRR
jgi:hypothetical protein